MKTAPNLRSTTRSSVDNLELKLPARARTVQIEPCSFCEDNSLFGIIVRFIKDNPGFTDWNLDGLRECVEILYFHLTFHMVWI